MGRGIRLAVLASGSGTNLQSILDAISTGGLEAKVSVVLSDKRGAFALERARAAGIPTEVVRYRRAEGRSAFESQILDRLHPYEVDWVVLAGFMRILTTTFLSRYKDRVVNIHPALLPAFPGVNAQEQAYEYGVKVAGCTVHFVDEGVDTGPIIAQRAVPVDDARSVEELRERILREEHRLYPQVLQWLSEGRVAREGRRVTIGAPE